MAVFYDPEDPSDAVLVRGIPDTLWRMAVPAFAFLFFGISMLMRAGRPETTRAEPKRPPSGRPFFASRPRTRGAG